jgi:hypothetical protein
LARVEQVEIAPAPSSSFLRLARSVWGAFVVSSTLLTAEQGPARKVHRNEAAGYAVTCPENWFSSGITYANAFELRNYAPGKEHLLPESERASLSIVSTRTADASAARAFLEDAVKNVPDSDFARLEIGGRPAVRIQRRVAARSLGPGASRMPGGSVDRTVEELRFHYVATFVADGERVVTMEASVPVAATRKTLDEVLDIEGSLSFDVSGNPRKP